MDRPKDSVSAALRGINDQKTASPTVSNEERSTFAHSKDKIVDNTGGTYNLNFLPNVLDQYDNVTYHWKLFITSLENAAIGNIFARDVQTIIAESGVTDVSIDRIELEGISVPSVLTGTGTQTTVKFEIEEPGGAGLIDKMYYEATALGIGNWLVMPCYLQLEFRARDPESGSSVSNGAPSEISGIKWVWPIKLTECKVHVSRVGAKYDFNAIMYSELAQANSYFSLQHNAVLSNLNTIGTALSELQDKLNADQYVKLIDNYSIPDTYRIVVDPKLANMSLVFPDDKENNSRSKDFYDPSKKTATFNVGTSIDKIVDTLLLNTKEYQHLLQGSQTSNGQPGTAKTVPNQMKKLWRIITESVPVAFDALRQDNAVESTIYIIPYDIGTIDVNAPQTGQTVDSLSAAKKRLGEYIEKRILNKIYNYIFTGLNDQIINFDLTLNYAYTAAISRFGGNYIDSSTQTQGAVAQQNAKEDKEFTKKLRETLRFINNATDKDKKEVEKRLNQISAELRKSKLPEELKQRYSTLIQYSKPPDRLAFIRGIKNTGGLPGNGIGTTPFQGLSYESLTTPVDGLRFASDINIRTPQARAAIEIAQTIGKGKLRPVAFRETTEDLSSINGITPASNSAAARVSSIFSTALYTQLDASLQTIKMTIKGDPYWLFPAYLSADATKYPLLSAMSNSEALDILKNSHKIDAESVNFYGTDNFIILRFRTPKIFEEYTSAEEPYTEIETFSGVYRVITVTSKFEKGKFTQELSCNLDPMINLRDFLGFLGDIEKAIRNPGTAVSNISETQSEINKYAKKQRLRAEELAAGQVSNVAGQVASLTNLNNLGPMSEPLPGA